MDITVYLPDALGKRAKEAELPLSRMLRSAVEDELQRRDAMADATQDAQVYEVEVEDRDGGRFTGRITGKLIAQDRDRDEVDVYLTRDERVIAYDCGTLRCEELDDPEEQLRDWLPPAAYTEACAALGIRAVIDL